MAVNAERQLLVRVSACDRQTHRQLNFSPSCPSNVLLQLLPGVRFATISSKLLVVVPCCRCVRLIVIFTLYGTAMFGRVVGRSVQSVHIACVYMCNHLAAFITPTICHSLTAVQVRLQCMLLAVCLELSFL